MNDPAPKKRSRPSRRHDWRSKYRDRQHEAAHAADEAPTGPALDHPLVPKGAASVITTDAQLATLLAELRDAGSFAYDSEFIGERSYFPKLCLLQVATTQKITLIDPLAEIDLTPMWEIFCDPGVEKIVHAGQQDLEPVLRVLQREPVRVFDTQFAAGFASLAYPASLAKLVAQLLGATLGKGSTFTHWDRRPLSSMQLRYAADDVRYLPALRQQLTERARAHGNLATLEAAYAETCDAASYAFNPEQYRKIRGAHQLAPRNLAVLRELYLWRDQAARQADLPPRTCLKDELLMFLAQRAPHQPEHLETLRGLPPWLLAEQGETLLEAVQRGRAVPAAEVTVVPANEENISQRFRADALWAATVCLCASRGIDASLVTSRSEVGEAIRRTDAGEPLDGLRLTSGWRAQAAGDRLLALIREQVAVAVAWKDGHPVDATPD